MALRWCGAPEVHYLKVKLALWLLGQKRRPTRWASSRTRARAWSQFVTIQGPNLRRKRHSKRRFP